MTPTHERLARRLARLPDLIQQAQAELVPIVADDLYRHANLQRLLYEDLPGLLTSWHRVLHQEANEAFTAAAAGAAR